MEGPRCRFRREARAASDIDTALMDSLKVLDPKGRLEKRTYPHPRLTALHEYVELVTGRIHQDAARTRQAIKGEHDEISNLVYEAIVSSRRSWKARPIPITSRLLTFT